MTNLPEALTWLFAALAGALLGAFFFGGLWWTVQRTLDSHRSVLWHLGGLLLRMAVTLSGFYLVGGGQWQRLAACLAGFVLARFIAVRMTRNASPPLAADLTEVVHAPES